MGMVKQLRTYIHGLLSIVIALLVSTHTTDSDTPSVQYGSKTNLWDREWMCVSVTGNDAICASLAMYVKSTTGTNNTAIGIPFNERKQK